MACLVVLPVLLLIWVRALGSKDSMAVGSLILVFEGKPWSQALIVLCFGWRRSSFERLWNMEFAPEA